MRYKKFGMLFLGLVVLGGLVIAGYFYKSRKIDISKVNNQTFDNSEDYVKCIKELSGADEVRVLEEGIHGERKLELVRNGKTSFVDIDLKDTKKPEFVRQCSEVLLPVGSSEQDLLREFKAEDESELLEYFVEGYINYNISGEYKVKVACSDSYSNTSTVDVVVKIE